MPRLPHRAAGRRPHGVVTSGAGGDARATIATDGRVGITPAAVADLVQRRVVQVAPVAHDAATTRTPGARTGE